MQADNERLTEEKGVLLESLCRQTEKLEDSRSKVDTLQGLLLREEQPQEASKGYNTEREQKLVDLLKVSTHLSLHAKIQRLITLLLLFIICIIIECARGTRGSTSETRGANERTKELESNC